MRKIIGRILLILGGLLVAASLVLTAYNLWDSWRADKAAQETLNVLEDEMADADDPDASDSSEADADADGETPLYELFPDMEMPVKTIDGYDYIGYLEIPSQDLKLPVMSDWDYSKLRISPCRYSGSVYSKDIVIAGHDYFQHFTPIKNLKIGDTVIFTDVDGNQFKYSVGWTEVIAPGDVELMTGKSEDADEADGEDETGGADASEADYSADDWDLTLFTCTFSGSSRYTVRCIMEDEYE